jgi:AraC-like DNA-binding protein
MEIFSQKQLRLNDASALCEAAQGFDVEFHQLDSGSLIAGLSYVVTQDCSVQYVCLDRKFHQRGSGPLNMFCFGLPERQRLRSWLGAPLKEPSLLNFSRLSGYDSVSERGFSAYTFAVTEHLLQRELDVLGSRISLSEIRCCGDFCLPDSSMESSLRAIGHKLISFSGNLAQLLELESSLAHLLATIISAGECIDDKFDLTKSRISLDKSLELIHDGDVPIVISDLVKHSGSSWRTVDRAFQNRFGIGPKQYITAVRLNQVREALKSAQPGESVTQIANDCGFSHLGRFSSTYKQMFGELPSQTLHGTVLTS